MDRDTIFSNPSELAVDSKKIIHPSSFRLYQNYPNPFNGNTTIPFELTQKVNKDLKIININGTIVKTFAISNYSVGRHTISWEATDNQNRSLPSGQYFYSIPLSNGHSITNKMIYIK